MVQWTRSLPPSLLRKTFQTHTHTHTSCMYSGLAGSGDFENAEVFALVDVVEDMWMKMIHIFIEKDEKRKVMGAWGRGCG